MDCATKHQIRRKFPSVLFTSGFFIICFVAGYCASLLSTGKQMILLSGKGNAISWDDCRAFNDGLKTWIPDSVFDELYEEVYYDTIKFSSSSSSSTIELPSLRTKFNVHDWENNTSNGGLKESDRVLLGSIYYDASSRATFSRYIPPSIKRVTLVTVSFRSQNHTGFMRRRARPWQKTWYIYPLLKISAVSLLLVFVAYHVQRNLSKWLPRRGDLSVVAQYTKGHGDALLAIYQKCTANFGTTNQRSSGTTSQIGNFPLAGERWDMEETITLPAKRTQHMQPVPCFQILLGPGVHPALSSHPLGPSLLAKPRGAPQSTATLPSRGAHSPPTPRVYTPWRLRREGRRPSPHPGVYPAGTRSSLVGQLTIGHPRCAPRPCRWVGAPPHTPAPTVSTPAHPCTQHTPWTHTWCYPPYPWCTSHNSPG